MSWMHAVICVHRSGLKCTGFRDSYVQLHTGICAEEHAISRQPLAGTRHEVKTLRLQHHDDWRRSSRTLDEDCNLMLWPEHAPWLLCFDGLPRWLQAGVSFLLRLRPIFYSMDEQLPPLECWLYPSTVILAFVLLVSSLLLSLAKFSTSIPDAPSKWEVYNVNLIALGSPWNWH